METDTKDDIQWLADILEESRLLFYGELEVHLNSFLKEMFKHEFREYGFEEVKMNDEFATAYWLVLSWLDSKNLFEYGTSPRGGWLTPDGERFKKIIMEHDNAIEEAQDLIYKKYNS